MDRLINLKEDYTLQTQKRLPSLSFLKDKEKILVLIIKEVVYLYNKALEISKIYLKFKYKIKKEILDLNYLAKKIIL